MKLTMKTLALSPLYLTVASITNTSSANLVNGGFEDGLNGWNTYTNVVNNIEGNSGGSANDVAVAVGETPIHLESTISPSLTNDHYAYTSQGGGGNSFITQRFVVKAGVNKVFFDLAIENFADAFYTPITLEYTGAENQQARFDIMKSDAPLMSLLDKDIIATVYQTQSGDSGSQGWQTYEFDISGKLAAYAGQEVVFRFVQVDNKSLLSLAIDNVNVGFQQFAANISTLSSAQTIRASHLYRTASLVDNTPQLLDLFTSLTGDDAAISAAVEQLSPLMNGSASTASAHATMNAVNRVLQAQVNTTSGLSFGDAPAGHYLWMKPFGSWAKQSAQKENNGFYADTYGLAAGFDGYLGENLLTGLSFAYADTTIKGRASTADDRLWTKSYLLTVYGRYQMTNGFNLDARLGGGINHNSGKRSLNFISQTASSSYDSRTALAGLSLHKAYQMSEATSFTPLVRLDYSWIQDEDYTESGAELLNLNVEKRSGTRLMLGTTGELTHKLTGKTTLTTRLGVGYDLHGKQSRVTSRLAGDPSSTPLSTDGINPGRWQATGGLGLVFTPNDETEVTVHYDVDHQKDFLNHGFSMKAQWLF